MATLQTEIAIRHRTKERLEREGKREGRKKEELRRKGSRPRQREETERQKEGAQSSAGSPPCRRRPGGKQARRQRRRSRAGHQEEQEGRTRRRKEEKEKDEGQKSPKETEQQQSLQTKPCEGVINTIQNIAPATKRQSSRTTETKRPGQRWSDKKKIFPCGLGVETPHHKTKTCAKHHGKTQDLQSWRPSKEVPKPRPGKVPKKCFGKCRSETGRRGRCRKECSGLRAYVEVV